MNVCGSMGVYLLKVFIQCAFRYRFAGRLIGYAIIQGQLLDVFFARHIYKALLGRYILA